MDADADVGASAGASATDGYDVSLGYEWCGGNAHVVICGDYIDPNRRESGPPTCSKHPCVDGIPCNCTYYPQQEIKLLLFINEINRQAMASNGRIIKLLGNHEVKNILSDDNDYQDRYTFSTDRELGNGYYLGDNRQETFNINKQGYNLLFKDGYGLVVKINNNIFVHGKINKSGNLSLINQMNQYINNPDKTPYFINYKKTLFVYYDNPNQILNNRSWGMIQFIPKQWESLENWKNITRILRKLFNFLCWCVNNWCIKQFVRIYLEKLSNEINNLIIY